MLGHPAQEGSAGTEAQPGLDHEHRSTANVPGYPLAVRRLVVWEGIDEWRAEVAEVELMDDGVCATGTQVGLDPLSYRLDYTLEARERFVTSRLQVEVTGEGWSRRLHLTHDGAGRWTCEADANGEVDLPPPGGDPAALEGALDCDLGLSPLTNLMPVRRHRLDERDEARDFLMAWVASPALEVTPYGQRYEHVRRGVVRFVDRGLSPGFEAELEYDGDGLVRFYPELARRV